MIELGIKYQVGVDTLYQSGNKYPLTPMVFGFIVWAFNSKTPIPVPSHLSPFISEASQARNWHQICCFKLYD